MFKRQHKNHLSTSKGATINFIYHPLFHIDTGHNVHIVNDELYLIKVQKVDIDLLQVSGTLKKISVIGKLPCYLTDGYYGLYSNAICMPGNPYCTWSSGASKHNDRFIIAAHDTGTSFILQDK